MPDENESTIDGETVAKLFTCWRILHMVTASYGSVPTGQLVIALTINVLHRINYSPTVLELCKATGLPSTNVSRYVNWQLNQGYLEEFIDPDDRRLRRLVQTEKGAAEMKWLDGQLDQVWQEGTSVVRRYDEGHPINAEKVIQRMFELTEAADRRFADD